MKYRVISQKRHNSCLQMAKLDQPEPQAIAASGKLDKAELPTI